VGNPLRSARVDSSDSKRCHFPVFVFPTSDFLGAVAACSPGGGRPLPVRCDLVGIEAGPSAGTVGRRGCRYRTGCYHVVPELGQVPVARSEPPVRSSGPAGCTSLLQIGLLATPKFVASGVAMSVADELRLATHVATLLATPLATPLATLLATL
jgi:hypothetical protein